MKRNINPTVLLYSLIFSLCLLQEAKAQQIKKTFSSSVEVAGIATIEIEDPKELDYEMHATMSSSYKEGLGYVLRPGVKGEIPCLIIPNYVITTWEKNTIKQEIEIEIIPDKSSPKEAQKLMNRLSLKIIKRNKKKYLVDGNMNLKKMELINGLFRKDRNTFILEDGSKYNVRQLVIKSKLYIPQKSNVQINSLHLGVEMGDLDGKLSINNEYGYIKTGNIKEVKANMKHVIADFKNIGKMQLNAAYSEINAHRIEQLTIGSLELLNQRPKTESLFDYDQSKQTLSFANKYKIEEIGSLEILESGNDQFNLGNIKNFKAINTSFSNFYIKKIEKTLELNGRNGDLTIYAVAPNFERLNIDNQTSTIELNLEEAENYQVNIEKQEKMDMRLKSDLQKTETAEKWVQSFYKGKKNKGGIIDLNCRYCEIIIN